MLIASISEDPGYSTASNDSEEMLSYMCGGSLRFVPLHTINLNNEQDTDSVPSPAQEQQLPTGNVYVAKGLQADGVRIFFVVLTKGFITFQAPDNLVSRGSLAPNFLN